VSVSESEQEQDRPVSHTVAGYLAAAAMFAGLASLVYYPSRIGVGAMIVALLAAAMAGPEQKRFCGIAAAVTGVCWVVGMTIAVLLERPIF
jgi:hypothetical protein